MSKDSAKSGTPHRSGDLPEAVTGVEEEQRIRQLQSAMERMDSWLPPVPTELSWFEAQVAENGQRLRRKRRREWLFFLLVAAVLLGGLATALAEDARYLIWVQVAGLALAPVLIYTELRKREGKRDGD